MTHAVGDIAVISAQEKIMRDATKAARLITDFAFDFTGAFLSRHFGEHPTKPEIIRREGPHISDAPNLEEFWLPFFVEL